MVEKQGVGSIWNKGGWHWEERNFSDFAKEYLTKAWCSIVHKSKDAEISIYEVKELKGSASVTIRKQKQIFMYEYEGELYWRANNTNKDGPNAVETCTGKIKIHEFNQEDDELSTEVSTEMGGKWVDDVKRSLRNEVTQKLLDEALKLTPALKAKDIDEEKLARAKAEAKAAEEGYQEAQKESGAQKAAIFEEAKKREQEMKLKEAAKPIPVAVQQKQQQVIQGTGSVWNSGSYHWEEKDVNKWAEATLRDLLGKFEYPFEDSVMTINEIKSIKGEAAVSIRKGKKIMSYDYAMTLEWLISLKDKTKNEVVSTCKGTYELPEVSNEEEVDDWEVRSSVTEDKDKLQSIFNQLIRTLAPKALRAEINTKFVDELKKK